MLKRPSTPGTGELDTDRPGMVGQAPRVRRLSGEATAEVDLVVRAAENLFVRSEDRDHVAGFDVELGAGARHAAGSGTQPRAAALRSCAARPTTGRGARSRTTARVTGTARAARAAAGCWPRCWSRPARWPGSRNAAGSARCPARP